MMRLKDATVEVAHLSTGILFALIVAEQVMNEEGYNCVVTSGNDGEHSKTSLHYANNAVDLRTWEIPDNLHQKIADEIKYRLKADYDVILEADHLHIEVQPRRRPI